MWSRVSEARPRGFGSGRELDFLFHKSLLLPGAIFASVAQARCCEFDMAQEGLNIGI